MQNISFPGQPSRLRGKRVYAAEGLRYYLSLLYPGRALGTAGKMNVPDRPENVAATAYSR